MNFLHIRFCFLLVLSVLGVINSSFSQIIFRNPPDFKTEVKDLTFLDYSSTRSNILLNGLWEVYNQKQPEKKTKISVPSIFEGDGELYFEKVFSLSGIDLKKHNIEIHFLGVSYSADVSINNNLIFRHPGGEMPFSFILPRDLLKNNQNNVLTVKINSKLDVQNTIPLKHRFLFPKKTGGIFRDVFLRILPNVHISKFQFSYEFNSGISSPTVRFSSKIDNKEYQSTTDSLIRGESFEIRYGIRSDTGKSFIASVSNLIELKKGKETAFDRSLNLSNTILWSPENPVNYRISLQIVQAGQIIDEIEQPISFYSLKTGEDSLLLNGKRFQFKGVTFIPSNQNYGAVFNYNEMERDIKLIKELGFNAVRFPKAVPHPYYLYLCERLGLLAFIEFPLRSVPARLTSEALFLERSLNYAERFCNAFSNFSSIASIGLGEAYVGNSEVHLQYLSRLTETVKKILPSKLFYASFSLGHINEVPDLDLYGIELLNTSITQAEQVYSDLQNSLGIGKVFITEAGYIANVGTSTGYTTPHSYEAQADYFEKIIDYSENHSHSGYFLSTMFDYRTDYNSIVSGFNNDKLVYLGILDENRKTNRLTYKVINSKLHNLEKVTIPMGIKKDDAPMVFIVFGLALALFMGFLVNSGRKFREDATRALLRPYNFFADIRDLRIISGVQTTLLALIIASVWGLIKASFLYSHKTNLFLEKVLLSFGSDWIINSVSYLIWHPTEALFWLSGFFLVAIIITTLLIKVFSFFVMNKVFFSNAYFTTVWALLPSVLLVPLAIVLYRLLEADVITIYLYIFLIIVALWIFYRLLKGIFVVYDVSAGKVYFYSFVFILAVMGMLILYFQLNEQTVDFIIQSYNERY